MARIRAIFVLLLGGCCVVPSFQITAQGQTAGSVRGVAVDASAGTPLAGVKVTLEPSRSTGDPQADSFSATTDEFGFYELLEMPLGEYRVRAFKDGFVWEENGSPLRLTSQEPLKRSDFKLLRLASLRGRVLDANKNGLADWTVQLLPYRASSLAARTGKDGSFTIIGISAGRYMLVVSPPLRKGSPDAQSKDAGEAWAPTYYPGTVDRAEAALITVRNGHELYGYDMIPSRVPVRRVRGRVVGADETARPISVRLQLRDWKESIECKAKGDGSFEFPAVPEGDWRLTAEASGSDPVLRGFESVRVARFDIEDVSVKLSRPFAVRGLVEREGTPAFASVYLVPVETGQGSQAFANVVTGVFEIGDVYLGRYRILPLGAHEGFYLDTVTLGGRDVLGRVVDLADGNRRVRVRYRRGGGTLTGTVESGQPSVVVLLPTDEFLLATPFIRRASATPREQFRLTNIRPGDYWVVAFNETCHLDNLVDVRFVRSLPFGTTTVRISGEVSTTVKIGVSPCQ